MLPVVLGSALALVLFAQAFVRLRVRGRSDHASWRRLLLIGLGVTVLTLALVSVSDAIADEYVLWGAQTRHFQYNEDPAVSTGPSGASSTGSRSTSAQVGAACC